MNMLKSRWFKAVALLVVCAFLFEQPVWAYPPPFEGPFHLLLTPCCIYSYENYLYTFNPIEIKEIWKKM